MKQSLLRSAAALVTAGGLLLASLFGSPGELLAPDDPAFAPTATAASATAGAPVYPLLDDEPRQSARRRAGPLAALRQWLQRAPFAVKVTLLLPLLLLGQVLLAVGAGAVQGLVGLTGLTAASLALGALSYGLTLWGLFALLFHALFPSRSLKGFFAPYRILCCLLAGLALTAADSLLPALLPAYPGWRAAALTAARLLLLTLVWLAALHPRRRLGRWVKRLLWSRGGLLVLLGCAVALLVQLFSQRWGGSFETLTPVGQQLLSALSFELLAASVVVALFWLRHHWTRPEAPAAV